MSKTKSLKNENKLLTFMTAIPNKNLTIFAILFLSVIAVIQCFGCLRGTTSWDESFYLTIPYRVILGDKLFVDEWHVAQTSSFVQIIPVWIFYKIKGSMDGIVLFSRHFFILFNLVFTSYTFVKIRKYGFFSAIFSAVLLQISIPETIFSLDYYTISLIFFELVIILLFLNDKLTKGKLILSGFFLALSVTAEPTIAILFFIYTLLVVVFAVIKKKDIELLRINTWAFILIGVIIAFVLFMIFILSQESLNEFISSIPNIFRSGEYSKSTLFDYDDFFDNLYYDNKLFCILSVLWIVEFFALKKVKQSKSILFVFALIIFAIATAGMFFSSIINTLRFSFFVSLFSLQCYLITNNKSKKYIPFLVASCLYFLCLGATSEAFMASGCIAFNCSVIFAFSVIKDLLSEFSQENKKIFFNISAIAVIIVLIISVGSSLFLSIDSSRFYKVYGLDSSAEDELVEIDNGPFKGISVYSVQKENYDSIMSDMKKLDEISDKYTVASHNATWCVLASEKKPHTFTTWFAESDINTFKEYYLENGLPEYIYIPESDFYFSTREKEYFDTKEDVEYFNSILDTDVIDASSGVILKVNGWKNVFRLS